MLPSSTRSTARFDSTKHTCVAPRDSASRPRAPDPENRSSTRLPGTRSPSTLNQASRTSSRVGRATRPSGARIRRPRNSPAMMRRLTLPSLGNPGPGPAPHAFRSIGSPRSRVPHRLDLSASLLQTATHAESDPRHPLPVSDQLQAEVPAVRPDPREPIQLHRPHHQNRIRIAGPERSQVAESSEEVRAEAIQRDLEIDAQLPHGLAIGQVPARQLAEARGQFLHPLPTDGEPGGHPVSAEPFEQGLTLLQGVEQVEPLDRAARAPAHVPVERDDDGRTVIALHQPGRDDSDDPRDATRPPTRRPPGPRPAVATPPASSRPRTPGHPSDGARRSAAPGDPPDAGPHPPRRPARGGDPHPPRPCVPPNSDEARGDTKCAAPRSVGRVGSRRSPAGTEAPASAFVREHADPPARGLDSRR